MRVKSNGVELECEWLGPRELPAVLMIEGLSRQLVDWHDGFCEELLRGGFSVVRFDNRDVGLSTKLDDARRPDLGALLSGDFSSAPYTLNELAADALGLLDALELRQVHLVGNSMGGMIAQLLAARSPDRVRTLTLFGTRPGDLSVGTMSPECLEMALRRPPATHEERIEWELQNFAIWGQCAAFPEDPAWVRDHELRRAARGYHPKGTMRQMAAILATPDWTAELGRIRCPTLVFHGELDPMCSLDGGQALARAIPGAELVTLPGLAHHRARGAWPRILSRMLEHLRGTTPRLGVG